MRVLRFFFMESFHFKFAVFLFMLLFLELFLINCVAVRCLEAENSALLQLKKGFTSGDLKSWLPGTDCCIWDGVTCDESGRITGLDLSFRFISGTINPSLFNLTSLDTLSFVGNNFDGIPIPDTGWDRLVNLSRLDLSEAGFVGKVPASISHLKKLTNLNLSFNLNLSMAINPTVFQNMSNLKFLFLHSVNVLTYRDEWCRALVNSTPFLEMLSMGNCSLFGAICSSLPMKLAFLDFSGNNLDSSIPDSFANFSSLSTLYLQGNNLKGVFPNQIFQLRNLESLDISDNWMLSGYLPEFSEYSYLTQLIVFKTNFSGNLPDSIGNLKFLTKLDLSSCQFYGTMPSSIRNLSELVVLNLSYNNLNGIVGLDFIKDLKNLNELDLSNSGFSLTQLDTYIESSSSSLPIFVLSLANNNLTGEIPTFICNLTNLSILDLSNNKLTGVVPPCLLKEKINLFLLNLGGNQLHGAIPHEISPKCELKIINLRDNKLVGLLPRSLSNCQALVILDLGNNNLKDTFPYWLGNMTLLRILILRSNKFYGLVGPPDGSHETNYGFPSMNVFDLSSNNFSGYLSAKCFSSFKSMMINKVEEINDFFHRFFPSFILYPFTIMNKGQLMTLQSYASSPKSIYFSNNHFEGEIPSAIGQLAALQVLNMAQNSFTGEIP